MAGPSTCAHSGNLARPPPRALERATALYAFVEEEEALGGVTDDSLVCNAVKLEDRSHLCVWPEELISWEVVAHDPSQHRTFGGWQHRCGA